MGLRQETVYGDYYGHSHAPVGRDQVPVAPGMLMLVAVLLMLVAVLLLLPQACSCWSQAPSCCVLKVNRWQLIWHKSQFIVHLLISTLSALLYIKPAIMYHPNSLIALF